MENGVEPNSIKNSILYALHYVAKARKDVKQSTISNCFLKAGFFQEVTDGEISDEEEEGQLNTSWKKLQPDFGLHDYIHVNNDVVTGEKQTVEGIVINHLWDGHVTDSGDDKDQDNENYNTASASAKTAAALETVRKYLSAADGNDTSFDKPYVLEKN